MSDTIDTTTPPTALLIIDAQAGLLDADDPDCRVVLERIAALAKRARATSTPVIYMQHDGDSPQHPLYPATPGWRISPLAPPQLGEPVLRKRASDSFYETPLQRELDARGVRRLVVAGAMTEFCVDTTCRRAASLGYDVTLVADAHETGDSAGLTADQKIAYHNAILADLATDHPILVIPAAEITFAAPDAAGDATSDTPGVAVDDGAMTKARLLARLHDARAQWEALLTEARATAGDQGMQEPGAENEWSVKDIVVHVTFYERWLDKALRAALAGRPYTPTDLDALPIDERNARIFAENRQRDLEEALAAEQLAYLRLLESVERLPERDLLDPARGPELLAPFWDDAPLWKSLAGETYEHYDEHAPSIRAWLAVRG
ncbi:MAG TPA: isochorismatase family protein [Ktedonobacterales bacterium]|nr:isochorismatase family protein [Ktedonobacterales bacterium]